MLLILRAAAPAPFSWGSLIRPKLTRQEFENKRRCGNLGISMNLFSHVVTSRFIAIKINKTLKA